MKSLGKVKIMQLLKKLTSMASSQLIRLKSRITSTVSSHKLEKIFLTPSPPFNKKTVDFIQYGREIPELNLTNTTPEHVIKVIKGLAPKQSCVVFGTSTKLVKFIGDSIAIPLAHIFNLSLSNGHFPTKLKKCRVIPIFKSGNAEEKKK
jgi:hypothetical protein